MAQWKRPETVPYPSIWRTFEGKPDANGVKRKYWVQDLTDEFRDEVFHHINTGFIKEELLCKHSGIIEDPQSIEDFLGLLNHIYAKKLALICLTKNENGEIKIAGFNNTTLSYEGEELDDYPCKGKACQLVLRFAVYCSHLKDLFTDLNVSEYLTAAGLYVLPEFRGEGISTEILKARRELCLAVGLKASGTLFTSGISQRSAERAGYKTAAEVPSEDLDKADAEFSFPGISRNTKVLKYMYIKYTD